MAAVLVYGYFRTANVETDPGLKIALIQGNIDIQLDNPDDIRETTDAHYRKLTQMAITQFPQTDLIVWPETVFCREKWPWMTGDEMQSCRPSFPIPPQTFHKWLEDWKKAAAMS